ncbi:hypothetical protein ABEO83_08455 [Bacillus glycinifermentans]
MPMEMAKALASFRYRAAKEKRAQTSTAVQELTCNSPTSLKQF